MNVNILLFFKTLLLLFRIAIGNMESFTDLNSTTADFIEINHIAVDALNSSLILVADGSALFTSDGTNANQRLVGVQSPEDYSTGSGVDGADDARFATIAAFVQPDNSEIIIADRNNFCIRRLTRIGTVTSSVAGACTFRGNIPSSVAANARFYYLSAMVWDYNNEILYFNIEIGNTAILKSWNKASDKVDDVELLTSTGGLVPSLALPSSNPVGTILVILGGNIQQQLIEGTTSPRPFFVNENITVGGVESIVSVYQDLYAVSDNAAHTLVLFNTANNYTEIICSGADSNSDGDINNCTISSPKTLFFDNENIYISTGTKIRRISGNHNVNI